MQTNQIEKTLHILADVFPNKGAMEIGTPYHTVVAVALSARTRDEQVLRLLPEFFKVFPDVQTLAKAFVPDIEKRINTIGMYKQKAKHLKAMATMIIERYGGTVPQTMEELILLPGVGRKTASVVLVSCFRQSAIAVDTHVHRVTNRLGWVQTKTPLETETHLLSLIDPSLQPIVNRVFVKLGRYICLPGRPRCYACPVKDLCEFKHKQLRLTLSPKSKPPPFGVVSPLAGGDVNPILAVQEDICHREEEINRLQQAISI